MRQLKAKEAESKAAAAYECRVFLEFQTEAIECHAAAEAAENASCNDESADSSSKEEAANETNYSMASLIRI